MNRIRSGRGGAQLSRAIFLAAALFGISFVAGAVGGGGGGGGGGDGGDGGGGGWTTYYLDTSRESAASLKVVRALGKKSQIVDLVPLFAGRGASFVPYGAKETFDWIKDIFFSPKRAKERVLMYGYDLATLDRTMAGTSVALQKSGAARFALVMQLSDSGLKMIGENARFFGAPIQLTPDVAEVLLESSINERASIAAFLVAASFGVEPPDVSKNNMLVSRVLLAVDRQLESAAGERIPLVVSNQAWPVSVRAVSSHGSR